LKGLMRMTWEPTWEQELKDTCPTSFSVCHPIYNDHTMNLSLMHAIYVVYSATLTEGTGSMVLLSSTSLSLTFR